MWIDTASAAPQQWADDAFVEVRSRDVPCCHRRLSPDVADRMSERRRPTPSRRSSSSPPPSPPPVVQPIDAGSMSKEQCDEACRDSYRRCADANPACRRPAMAHEADGGRVFETADGRVCIERCGRALHACHDDCFTHFPSPLNSVGATLKL